MTVRILCICTAFALFALSSAMATAGGMIEKFCMRSTIKGMNGMMSGTEYKCRNGARMFEVRETTINIGSMKQRQKQRTVRYDGMIYNVDLLTGRATKMKDPVPDAMSADMDPKAFAASIGFQPTGERRVVAGLKCQVYRGSGREMCMADNGLAPYMNIGGMVMTATEVELGATGSEKSYAIPKNATMQQMPAFGRPPVGGAPPAGRTPPPGAMPEHVRRMLEKMGQLPKQ